MKLKWDISGKGDEAWGSGYTEYTGPTPPKGSYIAKVKRMTLGKIAKQGENFGKPRISVLLEIASGQGANGLDDENYQYRGAPVWDGLNIIKNQTGRVNGFLHALTDGRDSAKRAIETAFWPPNGPKAEKMEKDGKSTIHITDIGKYHIGSPDGNLYVRIVTKMDKDLDGNPRAEINNYLPYEGQQPFGPSSNGDEADGDIIDDDDGVMDASDYIDSGDDSIIDADVVEDEPPF